MPEADKQTPDPSQQIFKIKVKGREREVTQDELIRLAQQNDDYAQNTEALKKREEALKEQETRVAGMKGIVDEMEANPVLKEALNKVYLDVKSGKYSKSEDNKDRGLKKLDKLISEATDPAVREQLSDFREIIQQEVPIEEVKKNYEERIAKLEAKISSVENATNIGHTERVESQLVKLEEKFGAELVGKHKKDILSMSLKYPNQSVQKLLYHFADDSELETAILNQGKKKEKEELERKKKGSFPGGPEGSFTAKTELKRDKAGKVTFESLRQRILERLGKA